MKSRLSRDVAALLLIALCWIAAIILVNPLGEFPSVDDWAYLSSVRALVERGEISLSDWTAPNLISQVFWGALFALPFGVNYTALRISTLVAALLGAFALFRLVRDAERPTSIALFAALLLLFNPIFFALSFTFMTDVPFVAAQTGAMLFLFAGLRSESRLMSALGWMLALVALLCRQTAFAIPFAYGGAYLVKHGLGAKRILIAALPLAIFIGVQGAYELWLDFSGRMPLQFGQQLQTVLPTLTGGLWTLATNILEVAYYIFFYLGLFLLPISFPAIAAMVKALPRKMGVALLATIAVITAVFAGAAIHAGLIMPIWPHTWHAAGIAADSIGIAAPQGFLEAITALSMAGGVLLVACLASAAYGALAAPRIRGLETWGFVFSLLGAAALVAVLSLISLKFDRYILPITPWLALSVAFAIRDPNRSIPQWCVVISGVFVVGMALYSVANEHNHMAEKRIRTAAIDDLVARGIPRENIDAGWVFNGEALYGRFGGKKSYQWYNKREYAVGFWPGDGYPLFRTYPVPRWPIWGSTGPDVPVFGPKSTP